MACKPCKIQRGDDEIEEEHVYEDRNILAPPLRFKPCPCPKPSDNAENGKPVRVYADGIYDLFHLDTRAPWNRPKKEFPNTYLLVGCCNDAVTHMYKGETVMKED